jgi:hypothetical protein
MKAFFARDGNSRLDLRKPVREKAHLRHVGALPRASLAAPSRLAARLAGLDPCVVPNDRNMPPDGVAVNRRTGIGERVVFASRVNSEEAIRESALA